ncbi:MAG: TolC family protein [Candidatus Acidiferrum sp.]
MNIRIAALSACIAVAALPSLAQETKSAEPRHLTIDEAVQLALKHNHYVRLAGQRVEESQHAKDAAHSSYLPNLRNDTNVAHLTDTQFIAIPQGSLGTVAGTPIPGGTAVLNQGGLTLVTSGTQLTQPLAELWQVRSANDVAAAEIKATRSKAQQTENKVALQVHQLYYKVLILQTHRDAAQAKICATDDLRSERAEQVRYGATLEQESIEARAQALDSRQDLLATELQLSDAVMQLDDAIGLPLTTLLALNPDVDKVHDTCEREECLRIARDSHPEIREAHAEVEKASAAVRFAKRQYIPSLDAFARYSYQDNVPFLAHNFGSFGIHLGYDLFDGGKRNAEIGERKSQLAQAEENLARIQDEVDLRVQTAYNKLDRTREMVKVSEELLALRIEVHRVSLQQLQQGTALRSQVDSAAAQELYAKTSLLQSQLDYLEAQDEMMEAEGLTP